MIKESIIFEGTVGDNIIDAIHIAISKVKELNKDVFIYWNGVTIRVYPDSTEDEIFKEYKRGLHLIELGMLEDKMNLLININ